MNQRRTKADGPAGGDVARGDDPILIKRNRLRTYASTGLRVGLVLFGAACVLFFYGVIIGFQPWMAGAISLCLLAGSSVLAPAMVLHYTIKGADRADRDGSW